MQIFKYKYKFLRSLCFFENENFAERSRHTSAAEIADFLELSSWKYTWSDEKFAILT